MKKNIRVRNIKKKNVKDTSRLFGFIFFLKPMTYSHEKGNNLSLKTVILLSKKAKDIMVGGA